MYIIIDKKHFHLFASLFLSYCWWCQKTPAENFQSWKMQILKLFCNKYNINYHQLFMLFQIFSLYHMVLWRKRMFQLFKYLLFFFNNCFCLTCSFIALVLLNYPSELSSLTVIYPAYSYNTGKLM